MPSQTPEAVFVELFENLGVTKTAEKLGISQRAVHYRRNTIEKKTGQQLRCPDNRTRKAEPHPHRLNLEVKNGVVLVGSDAHLWPGPLSTGFRGFVKFCRDLKPSAVILNGDVMDFPQISRHPPIGWASQPTVQEEIESAQSQLHELERAAGHADKIWTLGNHDSRFETRLATVAPEFARLNGFALHDYFPLWRSCWSTWINDNTVIKHRFRGGQYAPYNNTLRAGLHMVTGHLHSAKIIPHTDYTGTRYGVDSGCLADPDHKAFVDYTEDNPKDWRSAFVVLTYRNGELLWPELAVVYDKDHMQFRGEVIPV